MVGQLRTRHVERCHLFRHIVGIVDKEKRRLGVEEWAVQPGAGRPVDVVTTPGRPSHWDIAMGTSLTRASHPFKPRNPGDSPSDPWYIGSHMAGSQSLKVHIRAAREELIPLGTAEDASRRGHTIAIPPQGQS